MVNISAFKALKYDPGKTGNLSRVVSLPYDVITPKMQGVYYSKSEKNPVLFVHQQQFLLEGEKKIRTGLLCLVRLEEFAGKNILPHENTFPSHKADRLKLLEACGANMSPIFGLYEGSYSFKNITSKKPYAIFKMKDKNGDVINKVWCVRDEKAVFDAIKAFKNKKVFIADGHHRYEVGLFFKKKMRKLYPASTDSSWNYFIY